MPDYEIFLIEMSRLTRTVERRVRERRAREYKGEDYPTTNEIAQDAITEFLTSSG